MAHRDEIIHFFNDYLQVEQFKDFCPNGLQVEGKAEVKRIVTGVSASAELFAKAAAKGADMIIVHHGILWEKNDPVIKGGFRRRLELLLADEITLLAYHLPLDKHPRIGNNALAAAALGLEALQEFAEVGLHGKIPATFFPEFVEKVRGFYGSQPLIFACGPERVERIGICSGGAQRWLADAIDMGLDVYVTGEASEATLHLAKEGKIHFIAAGHYATERLGIRALGELAAQQFGVSVEFIDIPNPV